MATASRRLSRKAIRQPDKFITFTETLYDLVREHQVKVFAAAGALVVILVAIAAWQFYVQNQNTAAAHEFNRALGIYRAGNYREAISAFQKTQEYRWSHFYPLALLYETHSHLGLKDFDKAIESGRRLLNSRNPDPLVRQSGLLALGYAEEQRGLCKEAIQHYSEAEKTYFPDGKLIPGPLKDKALFGRARCSVQLGDLKGAIGIYREYLRQPDRELTAYVSAQIAELEAKSRTQGAK
jgi:tetratricopeptide (TPR) repeat protein